MTHIFVYCQLLFSSQCYSQSCGAFSYETKDLILLNWKFQPFEQNFLCLLRMETAG